MQVINNKFKLQWCAGNCPFHLSAVRSSTTSIWNLSRFRWFTMQHLFALPHKKSWPICLRQNNKYYGKNCSKIILYYSLLIDWVKRRFLIFPFSFHQVIISIDIVSDEPPNYEEKTNRTHMQLFFPYNFFFPSATRNTTVFHMSVCLYLSKDDVNRRKEKKALDTTSMDDDYPLNMISLFSLLEQTKTGYDLIPFSRLVCVCSVLMSPSRISFYPWTFWMPNYKLNYVTTVYPHFDFFRNESHLSFSAFCISHL